MESNELRFRHVGLSSDGAVVFCAMDNGKIYDMPLHALEQAEDWNPMAKPKAVEIIHDGYAVILEFETGAKIDFASDFVLHICEPSYLGYKGKKRHAWTVGERIREIRNWRRLTLDGLAAKCGIAKPNLSRLENGKVTPKFETLRAVAAALDTHPALLVQKDAWTWTRYAFDKWYLALCHTRGPLESVRAVDLVNLFLRKWPEHRYARAKLLKSFDLDPRDPDTCRYPVDPEKWSHEVGLVSEVRVRKRVRG